MNRCPISYEPCGDARYSAKGLRLLSPQLRSLADFPYSAERQRHGHAVQAESAIGLETRRIAHHQRAQLAVAGERGDARRTERHRGAGDPRTHGLDAALDQRPQPEKGEQHRRHEQQRNHQAGLQHHTLLHDAARPSWRPTPPTLRFSSI